MISVGVVMTVYLQRVSTQHVEGEQRQKTDVQLDDVRVSQQLQILDLALDPARHVSRHQPLAVDDFERDLLAADLVRGQLDLAKGALAEGADYRVLAQALVCL